MVGRDYVAISQYKGKVFNVWVLFLTCIFRDQCPKKLRYWREMVLGLAVIN